MPSRVVRPTSRRLVISGNDWLQVKDRLTHGEQQDAFARRYVANAFGGHAVNLRAQGMEKVTAYLLDWSLTDLQEHVIEIRGKSIADVESALNSIDPESFAEIFNAINTHEAAMAAAREQEKKLPATESGSPATSPSPEPPACDTPTSVN
jgi:hypothetical protein